MDGASSHIHNVEDDRNVNSKSNGPLLGPIVSEYAASSADGSSKSKELENAKPGSAEDGVDGLSATQPSFDNTTTYPPTSLGSDFDSRVSKPETDIGMPVAQDEDRSSNLATGHGSYRPVKSFSLPPWAIQTDSGSSNGGRHEQNDGLGAGNEQHYASRFSPSSPLVESPFTDDAAVRQQPTGAQLLVPPNTSDPAAAVPAADGYFPSALRVNTGLHVEAGPVSAASDPYTMHKTVGDDPIHQHTVPNAPRQLHPRSLSAYLAQHPDDPARRAIRKTYPKPNPLFRFFRRFKVRHDVIKGLSEQELVRFEQKEGKKRRRLAGWRLAEEDTEEDRIGEDGVERPVVSELFWKVGTGPLTSVSS